MQHPEATFRQFLLHDSLSIMANSICFGKTDAANLLAAVKPSHGQIPAFCHACSRSKRAIIVMFLLFRNSDQSCLTELTSIGKIPSEPAVRANS